MAKKPWRDIRKKLHEKPDVRVGKSGISPNVINEASKLLDKRGIIKIKFLRTASTGKEETKRLANVLAESIGGRVGKVIGRVAIIYKERGRSETEKV